MTQAANRGANLLGLDYRAEASRLGPPVVPIIDIHAHINGAGASRVYLEAARLFGVERVHTQTRLAEAPRVREVLGDFARFVAIPNFGAPDRARAWRAGFLDDIRTFHREFGARIVKFWCAPRMREMFDPERDADIVNLDGAARREAADLAMSLGMSFMAHVADPDTWFGTRYRDASRFLPKREHYAPLERMVDWYPARWIAAHMGGWPEDLAFLSGLLERHPNLHLDTSATKWMVRELSAHPREEFLAFMSRWQGRILFGSDIVTTDEHLTPKPEPSKTFAADLAASPAEAFELYASRYWALRTLLETTFDGPSPIADPDLAMVDPSRFGPASAPRLRGKSLPKDLLVWIYRSAAERSDPASTGARG